ncbi:MAG: hypoxanthine phosphoribosyltransferase [Bdellovibrionaceae bacterium]|nr:hypoxanthine phosphoribosyltransferase [Pseudobdellovibrionaceae bacterium]|tara:strand:- start:1105 stop:1647 length:543 start_codon:yes stop_codon:yes gene_type:complete
MEHFENDHFAKFLSRFEIEGITQSLAHQINQDYAGETVALIGVLKGSFVFLSDLIRRLNVDAQVDFVRMTRNKTQSDPENGTISTIKDLTLEIKDKHVIIVEEIIDSGRILKFLYDRIRSASPRSVEVLTLLDKGKKRLVDVPVKYVGKSIDDQFLVGYGLDLEEQWRNLSDIFYLRYPN